ncbi:hypothetical protein FACS1894184_06210 [Clostridia bacterium]|nr:hypothetical protein FACS1894184_06210 [Clostridia bacterium]
MHILPYLWRTEEQDFFTPCNYLLGYEKKDKRMYVEPEGAKTVQAIYSMFLNGYSLTQIAQALENSKNNRQRQQKMERVKRARDYWQRKILR